MHAATKVLDGGMSGPTRRRLLVAVAGVAVAGASVVVAASPAYADYVQQTCNSYHSWTECLSYDFNNGNLAVNALNGYSTAQTEALWIKIGSDTVGNQAFVIPAHSWRGFAYYKPAHSISACAGIDNVQIVCADFNM